MPQVIDRNGERRLADVVSLAVNPRATGCLGVDMLHAVQTHSLRCTPLHPHSMYYMQHQKKAFGRLCIRPLARAVVAPHLFLSRAGRLPLQPRTPCLSEPMSRRRSRCCPRPGRPPPLPSNTAVYINKHICEQCITKSTCTYANSVSLNQLQICVQCITRSTCTYA